MVPQQRTTPNNHTIILSSSSSSSLSSLSPYRTYATEATVLADQAFDGNKVFADSPEYPEHIVKLVDTIAAMTLLEVNSLNQLLKAKLNISDAAMMPMGGMVSGGSPAAVVEEEVEEEVAVVEQTEFNVKMTSYDTTKKVKLVKEIKNVMTDFNLVMAKKFVEAGPQVVREKISKEEAEVLKAQLEAAGATVEIE